jgi:hypothetical protein
MARSRHLVAPLIWKIVKLECTGNSWWSMSLQGTKLNACAPTSFSDRFQARCCSVWLQTSTSKSNQNQAARAQQRC